MPEVLVRLWAGLAAGRRRAAVGAMPPNVSLGRDQGLWLMAAAAVSLAPHATRLPGWLSALCGLLLAWRALLLWQRQRPPARLVVLLLAIAAGVSVWSEFGHLLGKDPGVAMLAVLLGLKLLEIRAARDIRAAVLLCFFLQLAVFFEDQSLGVAALSLCGTLLSVITLLALVDPGAGNLERLRTGTLLLTHGIPFMLALFLLFPRVQGPLWGLPADAFSGRTGLSDSMSPGSISQLGRSSEIAFRAAFAGPLPAPAQRYWRGPVLTEFDGESWRADHFAVAATPFYAPAGPSIDYSLTVEAHNRRWVLALDFPGANLGTLRYTSDYQLQSVQPLAVRTRFNLRSYPQTSVGIAETDPVLAAAKRLPDGFNPRSRALAARLAAGATSEEVVLQRVIEHLRDTRLTYTLRPPLLGRESVDDFLFETQQGFCEHFASAFTFLMRAAGVPARVVTGYQGGELNPVDGNLVVRQADAHAWAEVWLAGQGWTRVDPTALSAPRRIEDGLAAALPDGELLPLLLRPELTWLRHLRYRWEAVSNAWNQRVLGYNPDRQREFLSRLGLARTDWSMLAGLLSGAMLTVFVSLLLWTGWRRRSRDPLERCWARFSTKLARCRLGRRAWEGPLDYGDRISAALPQHADGLRDIAASYARLRYGNAANAAETRALARKISELKLP